jgi:hypothetical protein
VIAAEVDYATMLYLGQGVKRDLAGAVRWYRQAAEQGNPVAQNRYAKLLAVGEGVDLNLEQAAMWRALARRQGLADPTLDRLLVSISPKDLAQAEEEARFWPLPPPEAEAAPTLTGKTAAPASTDAGTPAAAAASAAPPGASSSTPVAPVAMPAAAASTK